MDLTNLQNVVVTNHHQLTTYLYLVILVKQNNTRSHFHGGHFMSFERKECELDDAKDILLQDIKILDL